MVHEEKGMLEDREQDGMIKGYFNGDGTGHYA
jgi:hypothetical protein